VAGAAAVPNAAQFFPGLVRISASGLWKLKVIVGHDHMCVEARFRV
jgi:hypothetical protein